jgi:RHS repeat-associated protein
MLETNFFWDPLSDNILQERDETGAVTAEYNTEPGRYGNLISQNRGGAESQYHFDAQGSALALSNDSQHVTDTHSYTAFGEASEQTGNAVNPFEYVGRKEYYADEATRSSFVRRRHFLPLTGRWLSVDPLAQTGKVVDFTYVLNSPLSYADPSGNKIYAVDGTSWTWDDKSGKSNVQRLLELSLEGASYWRGPKIGGEDSASLRDSVYTWICKDLCAARGCSDSFRINMSGWSRGAVIVVAVAHLLNDRGCCCDNPRYNRATPPPNCCPSRGPPPPPKAAPCADLMAPPIPVNWIGLFDAVGWMLMDLLDWRHSFPPNVASKLHAVHTGKAGNIKEALFVTWKTLTPIKDCWRFNGDPTTHNDVGTKLNNNAFYDICDSATNAGVRLRECRRRKAF